MKKIFVIISLCLLWCNQANAHCRVIKAAPVYYNPVYTPPVYHNVVKEVIVKEVPIAVPVYVPAYQFQYQPPCYAAPCAHPAPGVTQFGQQHVSTATQVAQHAPTAAAYGSGPPAVQSQFNVMDNKDKIRELAKALLEEMQKQADAEADQGPPPVYNNNPAQNPHGPYTPNNPAQNPHGPYTPNNPNTPTFPPGIGGMTKEQAAPIAIAALQRNCSACHTGVGSRGDTMIFSQPGILDQHAPWGSIKREVTSGRMPPKQSQFRPTPEEVSAIRIWLSDIK